MEELTVEYVKVGSLQIPESVVISWVIMLLLVVGSILLTRNLKVDHISKRQAALEALYSLGKNFFEGLLGKEGSRYVPFCQFRHAGILHLIKRFRKWDL